MKVAGTIGRYFCNGIEDVVNFKLRELARFWESQTSLTKRSTLLLPSLLVAQHAGVTRNVLLVSKRNLPALLCGSARAPMQLSVHSENVDNHTVE